MKNRKKEKRYTESQLLVIGATVKVMSFISTKEKELRLRHINCTTIYEREREMRLSLGFRASYRAVESWGALFMVLIKPGDEWQMKEGPIDFIISSGHPDAAHKPQVSFDKVRGIVLYDNGDLQKLRDDILFGGP